MKNSITFLTALILAALLPSGSAAALTLTNATNIGALNTNYDGADIVVSNCTVTVDGAHAFNSLLVASNGVLTHSFFPTGIPALSFAVTNEPQVLTSTNPVTLINSNVTGAVAATDLSQTVIYTNGADFVQSNLPDGTTQIFRTDSSAIPDGATVLVSYTWSYRFNAGLNLTITNDVTVAISGSINAAGIGYGPGTGSGAGTSSGTAFADGSGAGHGGCGGMSSSNAMGGSCYGNLYSPTTLGSGGGGSYAGGGGSGGGAIQISAGGSFNLYGTISANGMNATNSRAGGGAGGSVWIIATNFNGSGSLTANGGNGELIHGGGGGGGRISIQCATNNFSGTLTAYGGAGWRAGGAGTIFVQTNGQNGLLVLDNGGHSLTVSTINLPNTADVLVTGGAIANASGIFNCGNLTIATNSKMSGTLFVQLSLNVSGDLNIQPGGEILMDGTGSTSGTGTGHGSYYSVGSYSVCGGGGYGGYGGYGTLSSSPAVSGGGAYGSQTAPYTAGSGGGGFMGGSIPAIGGNGGGAIQLSVSGTLRVDGCLSANGDDGLLGGGGGSGGGIYITHCGTLAGTGSIRATGGAGGAYGTAVGGGGGGGRIAIYPFVNSFTGAISAAGGGGASYGGAGTIFLQTSSNNTQQLILDNAGHNGTNTLLSSASSATLIVQNGARGVASSGVTFSGLLVASNGWLVSPSQSTSSSYTINGNATIQSGGGFIADSDGSLPSQGYGGGSYSATYPYGGGGGGHGAPGGNSISNSATGGSSGYDYFTGPYYTGGSGGGFSGYSIGGPGGGFIRMIVNGTLQLDGVLSANGGNGSGLGGGGGAGGSVYLTTTTFAGSGAISANGGTGANAIGGGGGGGLITLYFNNTSFNGTMTAVGGGGANWGGAGIIYLKTNSVSHGQIIVDNAGHLGPAGTVTSSGADLTLQNGANSFISGSVSLGNVMISSNAWLIVTNSTSAGSATISAGNVTVQAGGGIIADYSGYTGATGSSSYPYPGAGGGHGGSGGYSILPTLAPGNYGDNPANPFNAGNGGGGYGSYSIGGKGGGVIALSLTGNLQVDGTLSANGGNGSGSGGGGGAGGAVNITCANLFGSGVISANGGAGAALIGGGGGGGLICAKFATNGFSGTISAYAGGGANYGGAGIVYFQTNSTGQSVLIADNGGHLGNLTPLYAPNYLVIRNGATAFQNGSAAQSVSGLLIASNGWLEGSSTFSGQNLTVNGDAIIQAGGGIVLDAAGSSQNSGSGAGHYYSSSPDYQGSGAGHGGYGGAAYANAVAAGGTYDSPLYPSIAGSGGGGNGSFTYSMGGNGGGIVRLTVNGTLQLDGSVSANGGTGSGIGGGGGSGGSIYLTLGTFTGGGAVAANGGNGATSIGGGGGGGMIAIYFNTNAFTGPITAYGGSGAGYGGAGTVYLKSSSLNTGQLVVDNGGRSGAGTGLPSSSSADWLLQNGGTYFLSSSVTAGNVLVSSNACLIVTNLGSGTATFNAVSLTVQPGGIVSANYSSGYSGFGISSSSSPYYAGGGGGHAAYGGIAFSNLANGGMYYDNAANPSSSGNSGGGYSPYSTGGSGGGALTLSLSNDLQMDGTLSANGGNGSGTGGGGGAGGSLKINCASLSGTGTISANGGSGVAGIGGGGSGGMIFANFKSNTFSGNITAYGGGGANYGGAGTIYFQTNLVGASPTLLIVDNGTHRGTNTPLASANNYLLRNGATAFPTSSSQTLNSLLITSNAWLMGNSGTVNLVVNGNAVLQPGGGISTTASGNAQNSGNGHGNYSTASAFYPSSGGSHGGYGGASMSNLVASGTTSDSTASPSSLGSGGGGYSGSIGGNGGGLVRLIVNGLLQLDGAINANGGNGFGGGGGGSGGAVYLAPASISGAGSITANGGNGGPYGGGGGGGRIAINIAQSNSFTGLVSAYGGVGVNNGGAGTIYWGPSSTSFQQLILDNGGNSGTNTTFDILNANVTIQNGAAAQSPTSSTWIVRNMFIRTNGTLAAGNISADNLTIDPGGILTSDSLGSPPQSGIGRGLGTPVLRGGGGYGGFGGGNPAGGGFAYGSITAPNLGGSGGASYGSGNVGGYGGGVMTLSVGGVLTNNGRISANGGDGNLNSGGGSGGSIYISSANRLTGSGVISANGGSGSGAAGGGSGGRISINVTSNTFAGPISAYGGGGAYPGGAGTIYFYGTKTLLVDNGGINGTNTPISGSISLPANPFDLNISGAAKVVPLSPLPLLADLNLASGAFLTMPTSQSNLVVAVQKNANIAGSLTVDTLGYTQGNGPGAGQMVPFSGSGGGYGGSGGNSTGGAIGGITNGSAAQPVDFGSGGGAGVPTTTGGSEGGGALRLSVGGTLNVDGNVSANGDFGWQDNSGGGAGGSIWITATTLTGQGTISAAGGDGDLWNGGGGGGGRIAIYSPTNLFAGITNLDGGNGAFDGQPGTLFLGAAPVNFLALSLSPAGLVTNTVSAVDVMFNEAVNPASVSPANFTLVTPGGTVPMLSAASWGANTVHVTFQTQNLLGNYSFQAGTNIANIFGQPPAQGFAANFTISLQTISGFVTNLNGAPIAGVAITPNGSLSGAITDTNGFYSIGFPPGWSGTLTPSSGTNQFVPSVLGCTIASGSLTNQNFLMVPTVAPTVAGGLIGTNLSLAWRGIPGVTYEVLYSADLVNWIGYGGNGMPMLGTNGPMQVSLPIDASPTIFFRIEALY